MVNMRQCINSTSNGGTCLPRDVIENIFTNDIASANYFYSSLYLQSLPTMNDFDSPLKTTLVNHYEMTNLKLTKRNIQTYKQIQIESDNGWLFPDIEKSSIIAADVLESDFTLKDEVKQDIVFTQLMYLGRKVDVYVRSYTKVQEVLANIGGFTKFFYMLIYYFYSFFSAYNKDLNLLKQLDETYPDIKSIPFNNRVAGSMVSDTNTMFKHSQSNLFNNKVFKQHNEIKLERSVIKDISSYSLMKDYICVKVCRQKSNNHCREVEYKFNLLNQGFEVNNYIKMFIEFYFLKKIVLSEEQDVALGSLRPVKVALDKRVFNVAGIRDNRSDVNIRLFKLLTDNMNDINR
jgi:hypothetical protein